MPKKACRPELTFCIPCESIEYESVAMKCKACGTLVAAALSIAFASAAQATTTVAQWAMDNTFGTTMTDSSGNANDGTAYNIVTSGAGYIFDGQTSKVVVPDSPTLNPGSADFSFSVQVQTSVVPLIGTDYDVLRKGNIGTKGGEYKIEIIRAAGKARAICLVKDSLRHSATINGGGSTVKNLADNQLHTITCTKTATSLTIQIDAGAPVTKSVSLGSINNTLPLLLGVKTVDAAENDSQNDWYNGAMRNAIITVEP